MKILRIGSLSKLEVIEDTKGIAIRPGFVRVRISACGVCGSDISILKGERKAEPYFGHEFTGVVTEVGPGVPTLKVGMRVASGLIKTCGSCWYCRNGHPNYCRSMDDVIIPGGFASETIVEHTESYQFLTELPETIDDITGTLNEPIGCALRIANQAEIKLGQSVLVIGLGAMGAITSELLRMSGAGIIVGMDLNENRLEVMRGLGYENLVNRKDEDWLQKVKEATGPRGVDLIIETTGSPKALDDAFQAARTGARIVVGSVYHGQANGINLSQVMRKELTVVGAKGPFPYQATRDSSTTIDILNGSQLRLKRLIKTYSYNEAMQAFSDASEGYCTKSVIVF